MPERNESPAVQSLRKEQKLQQRAQSASELDKALEDTFPASDPASATHTATLGGLALDDSAEGKSEYLLEGGSTQADDTAKEKHRVNALYRAARQEDRSSTVMESKIDLSASGIALRIREKPIASILAAMAIGFAYGLTR
ncbi:hypothetical protein HGP16_14175 [Rhizobium sp. P40RR-XXII]|uniref:hypothetical protein n=1 Tax=Rhizobium sp. P40RR-XXII TaxID=2726739 RepID=UPI001457143C|nr:hypothetical protein [Rhizobium sp. P40RR-XXII]NLS17705.1 hypothetical protein [Rhizobium sp. P40RR-XXII]